MMKLYGFVNRRQGKIFDRFEIFAGTYTSRNRRSLPLTEPPLNIAAVEKRLIAELGEHVCVFEKVCDRYAEHARTLAGSNHVLNWEQVFK
jgi:hypothetical protein